MGVAMKKIDDKDYFDLIELIESGASPEEINALIEAQANEQPAS